MALYKYEHLQAMRRHVARVQYHSSVTSIARGEECEWYLRTIARTVPPSIRHPLPGPLHNILLYLQLMYESAVHRDDFRHHIHDQVPRTHLQHVR